jgi:hypothetical protein
LDDLHEQYPATDAEALAPRSLDKRLPAEWLQRCYRPQEPLPGPFPEDQKPPAIPGLRVYALPVASHRYVIGADPAEGNPTSDDSALVVLDVDSREEVASLAGRFEPATFAAHLDAVGRYYQRARLLVERNNHGHAVLLWLRDHSELRCLGGHDLKTGWLSNSKGKPLLYDRAGEVLRDGEVVLHSLEIFSQLASIEGSTLRAPEGQPDDLAMAFVLGCQAMSQPRCLYYNNGESLGLAPPEAVAAELRLQRALARDGESDLITIQTGFGDVSVHLPDDDPPWWER